jgi:S1-C subfamily serine protease
MRQLSACLLFLLLLTGCKSPLEKIDQFAAVEDFDGALAFLIEKGVAPSVSAELDRSDEDIQKLLAARELYRGKIEDRFGKEAASALERGNSRSALRLADAALVRCVWSDELRQLATRAAKAVALLDEGLAAHARLEKSDLAAHWRFVERFKPDAKLAADDAAFIEALESVSRRLAAAEAEGLRGDLERGDAEAVNARIDRLRRLYVDESQLAKVAAFAQEILSAHVVARLLEGEEVRVFIAKRDKWRGITQPQLQEVVAVLMASVDGWMARSLRLAVERRHDAKGLVDAVEELYVSRGRQGQSTFCLADLHVIRGARLAKEGANASAALFHFERAKELDPSADVVTLIDLAKSTRGKLKTMTVSLTLSSGAEAAADTIGPVYYISALNLIEKTRDGVRWKLAEPETPGADVTLFIEKAERFVPKVADLSVVQSRYFAHMQSVANPQKGYLKGQLNAAEMSYQFSLSSYNSAVSSFNIYPSQYSLNTVNYAENNLESARTHYNSLVSLYNATPTTIEQPVYMPYSYFEGNMRCGYIAAGKVVVRGTEAQFASRRVDSHYVRLNTKFTDISASSRRDVQYPVDNVSEQLFANIVAVAADVTEKVASVRILPADEFIGNLSEGEKACVAYAMHPLKQPDAVGLGLPGWAFKFAEACRFVGVKVLPPQRYLERCVREYPAAFDDPSSIALMRGMVCRIDCQSPFGDSRGSGAVISADGLILTAAHVIRGSANKVVFNSGPNKGAFDTEIVFVDDRSDVAVLRAKSLRPAYWFNVRLNGFPSPGDPIMAIGYPGRPSGGDATQDFVTKGIISASNSSKGWLVADLTVASGNSGGPIISTSTGEIVGVVSQVISASIKKDYAASGFWCKAFPAARLTEALGLKDNP